MLMPVHCCRTARVIPISKTRNTEGGRSNSRHGTTRALRDEDGRQGKHDSRDRYRAEHPTPACLDIPCFEHRGCTQSDWDRSRDAPVGHLCEENTEHDGELIETDQSAA